MNLVTTAARIAMKAHQGQERWHGAPYINHPKRVADAVDDNQLKVIAWLHDTMEDTYINEGHLIAEGIPRHLIKAIEILTRRKDETYYDFILRIRKHDMATKVKIADITDNIKDNLKEGSLKDKYRLARYILKQRLVCKRR